MVGIQIRPYPTLHIGYILLTYLPEFSESSIGRTLACEISDTYTSPTVDRPEKKV